MNTFRRYAVILCALPALMSIGRAHAAAPKYTLVDLGTLGGSSSDGYAINASGLVAGDSSPASNNVIQSIHGFLWSNGRMTDLGTLGGVYSHAVAVNSAGQVAGSSQLTDRRKHAFVWSANLTAPTDLGTLGGDLSAAYGINDSGTVVGASRTSLGSAITHAFLWSAGKMTDLGTLGGGNSGAWAINRNGEVVGYSDTASHTHHAFLRNNGQMTDLGTLGGSSSSAYAINTSGVVVGDSLIDSVGAHRHAFLWNGSMVDLDPLGSNFSSAHGINSAGDVVGNAQLPTGLCHAFLYHQGTVYDLNDLLPALSNTTVAYANGINDAGQISGVATINGAVHAVLLEPAPAGPALTATAGVSQVTLNWTASAGALVYRVYRSIASGGESNPALAGGLTSTSFIDSGAVDGATYYYKVTAVNTAGPSPFSNEAHATLVPAGPALTATAGASQVTLHWTASSGALVYRVYRSTTAGGEVNPALAGGIMAMAFTDTSAVSGATYYYKVTAVNTGGASPFSNEAHSALSPMAPADLTATLTGGHVLLNWTSSAGALVYRVYRSTSSHGEANPALAGGITTTAYTDTSTFAAGTTYYYEVTAVNTGGASVFSNEAHATPAAAAAASTGGASGLAFADVDAGKPAGNGGQPPKIIPIRE